MLWRGMNVGLCVVMRGMFSGFAVDFSKVRTFFGSMGMLTRPDFSCRL